jgi:hypothetical protein
MSYGHFRDDRSADDPAAQREHDDDVGSSAPATDMTRGQQTAWIVGTLIVMALAFAYWATRLPDGDPYAECQRIIGHDNACRAEVAAGLVMRGY